MSTNFLSNLTKVDEVEKFRLTFEGGERFKEKYLKTFSSREPATDFEVRKSITYVPAFAKTAIYEITNSIFSRLPDVVRLNGTESYKNILRGDEGGVDNADSSMNAFIGGEVLPEMCAMRYVGVFVDMPAGEAATRMDDNRHPYCYVFKREDILDYTLDKSKELVALKLRALVNEFDDDGLVSETVTEHRYFRLMTDENGEKYVSVRYTDESDSIKDAPVTRLDIPMIPFALFSVKESLLKDVADYQIALLNMASANVSYDVKSNFPFYVEQADPMAGSHMRTSDGTATADSAKSSGNETITTGATIGRSYAKGLERPSFIHPSAEPLEVSMKKQQAMKEEIRQLVNLAVSNMPSERESAESKKIDQSGLDAGLAYLGGRLEKGERRIAAIWQAYMGDSEAIEIKYPEEYSSKTVAQRLEEAQEIVDLIKHSPSITYQREMTKQAAVTILQNRIPEDKLEAIRKEIDDADVVYIDPEVLNLDIEAGLVTTDYASGLRGYPEGEAKKAHLQKVDRAAMIVAAQTKAGQGVPAAGARGVPELDPNTDSANEEKELSQDRSTSVDNQSKTRGKE